MSGSCNDCLRLHGASGSNSSDVKAQFVPTGFVKDISSAYCGMPTATAQWAEFAKGFSATHPVTYGTETGGTDLLKDKTAVSNYFTSTPVTTSASSSPATTASARLRSSGSGTTAAGATPQSTGGAGSLQVTALWGPLLLGAAWIL